ncbi:hypothetical protein AB1Y20_022959 [Prymnesium parvum]|uniref:Uncharacterized protein n=1 Tax=Prymnesium parvum TaxID=97485 RepID=A0AB34JE03_PRYPA
MNRCRTSKQQSKKGASNDQIEQMAKSTDDTTNEAVVMFPKAVFEHQLDKALRKHVRPPTKKHLGRRPRISTPIMTTVEIVEKDPKLMRSDRGGVLPVRTTPTADVYKIKLQDPSHVNALFRTLMEDRAPPRGLRATQLVFRL